MARRRELQIFITGNADDARRAFKDVEAGASRLGRVGGVLRKIGAVGGLALGGLATAAGTFGVQAVKEFGDAEQAQVRLSDAFRKFPKLADTNLASLNALNSALQTKTRFDDESIASGQAQLAQFGLTGRQLTELTPLLLDYAAKTGKDVPDAAKSLGKALLGKGRALADIGIKFKDAGSVTANYTQLVGGLRSQVGGFAQREGKTAAGSLAILKNSFNEVLESVGAALMPALRALMPVIQALVPVLGTALGGVVQALAPLLLRLAKALGPILTKVVRVLTPVLGVLGDALGDVLVAVLPLLPPLAELLTAFTPLIPPLAKLITLLVKSLMPFLQPVIRLIGALAGVMSQALARGLEIVTALVRPLAGIFRAIGRAIEPVIGFVRRLGGILSKLKLPDWLIPGSPTPLETGLRGIGAAFRDARQIARGFEVPDAVRLRAGASRAPAALAPGTGGGDVIVHLNGAVLGDVPKVVDMIRRELLRTKGRNGSTGL